MAREVRKKRQQRGKQFFAYLSDKGEACKKAAAMVGANRHYVTDAKKIEQDAPCSPPMMTHADPCVSFGKKRHL